MKNKDFFYLQYDKINWENQENTKINSFVNNFIIEKTISRDKSSKIKLFDMGFGIGFFMKEIYKRFGEKVILEGCEPSKKNYNFFLNSDFIKNNKSVKIYNTTFLGTPTKNKFNFITSIYVFPHFVSDELDITAKKINLMLEKEGKFILVVANEKYLEKKLSNMKDLSIEKNKITLNNKAYSEVLHYSDIPEIGKVIDYNREEKFYLDLFNANGFELEQKSDLDDKGFICTVFVFKKIG